jgi:endoglucanase
MTQWQQAREEWIFQSVKEKGFDWVRIPVQWGARADASGNIYGDFMGQVEETVGWAKKHGLVALINAHHEDWFDNGGSLDRLVNIWRQIAEHFKGYGDNELVFELFNEPNAMSLDTLNQMNRAVLSVIRKNNPTRLVFLGGLKQMGRWWINANPDAMQIPAGDENLGLTVHSYDPYSFAGPQPSLNSFGDAEVAAAEDQQRQLSAWARARGIKQVVLNEFGVTVQQSNRYDRLKYYHANSQACAKQGQGYAIWDDNGWWQVLNRNSRSWDEGVLENLVSPHKEIVGV